MTIICAVCGSAPQAGDYGMIPADEAFDRNWTAGVDLWYWWVCPKPECQEAAQAALNRPGIENWLRSSFAKPRPRPKPEVANG